jgi:hypothetical protein
MSDLQEDQRLALANMYALALATLRARDADAHRAYLDALADFAPDPLVLGPDDPRSDEALGAGVTPAPAARRFAARLRGVVLGAAAHADTASRELAALAREVAGGEGVADGEIARRAGAAFAVTRADLERDVVRLGGVAREQDPGAWVRRWGVVRSLELNGFAATFTRDGTHSRATAATREGRDAGALRFVLALSQAALSLPREQDAATLSEDVQRAEVALPALLANLVAAAR